MIRPRDPLVLILLVLAILAFLIQMIGEIVGFLSKRYFEELLAAALADIPKVNMAISKFAMCMSYI